MYVYNKDLHLGFVDFKQAYNSTDRKELKKTMKSLKYNKYSYHYYYYYYLVLGSSTVIINNKIK